MKFSTHRFLPAALLLFSFNTMAQLPVTDQLATLNGPLVIQAIGHASVVLKWNGKIIDVDPVGAERYQGIPAPDVIFITDIHGDHFDLKTLAAINTKDAVLVVPQAVAALLPAEVNKKNVVILANGEHTTTNGVPVSAIPMYNLPESADAKHTKGRGNGYILELGGKNIYFSGDTQGIPEMLALKNIAACFLCMNLPYTMGIQEAAKAVLIFKPKIVYPYHHRGQDIQAFKQLVNAADPSIDVRLLNWYATN